MITRNQRKDALDGVSSITGTGSNRAVLIDLLAPGKHAVEPKKTWS